MKKITWTSIILFLILLTLVSFAFNVKTVKANGSNYTIEHVKHTIKIMYNGYVFINDTIQVQGDMSEGFLIGFPYKYGQNILQCVAFNSTHIFPVSLDVPLNNTMGFYGVKINFPYGTPTTFTVGFVLSNNLLTQNASTGQYTLDFPAYPAFIKPTNINASISIEGATYIRGNQFTYGKENLPELTYSIASTTFLIATDKIQLFDINEMKSEFRIDETGAISCIDNYYITNKAKTTISSIEITLPLNASNPSVQDQFGRALQGSWINETTGRYKVSFSASLESSKSSRFSVKYQLQKGYVTQTGIGNFNFRFPLFKNVNCYINEAFLTFVMPEGARISNLESTLAYSVTKNVFQEMVTVSREDVSYLDNIQPLENVLQTEYRYNPLWASFRPTLWMWALALLGCVVAVFWKRPKAAAPLAVPKATIPLRFEDIKSFIELYKEKQKINQETESLENMVRKGRIPRERYKVRKKTLETRLNVLSRNLTELKEKLQAMGGKYADTMRQLEIAEIEINEAETGIKSIEARHNRGEISLEAYRKLLSDYQRRKEKAEMTINGILLRLREEMH